MYDRNKKTWRSFCNLNGYYMMFLPDKRRFYCNRFETIHPDRGQFRPGRELVYFFARLSHIIVVSLYRARRLVVKKLSTLTLIAILAVPPATVFEEAHVASWYGGTERLREYTANGEVFDSHDFTCASWNYPFGTKLTVTNIANKRSVVVRVNDRGPHRRLGRSIDLTKRAFEEIAETQEGISLGTIERYRST